MRRCARAVARLAAQASGPAAESSEHAGQRAATALRGLSCTASRLGLPYALRCGFDAASTSDGSIRDLALRGPASAAVRGFASAAVTELSDVPSVEALLQQSEKTPVILQFHADWCGPCKQLGPLLEAAVDKTGGKVLLGKIDVDNEQLGGVCQQLQITSIPALFAFYDKKLVHKQNGGMPAPQVDALVTNLADLPNRPEAAAGAPGAGADSPPPGTPPAKDDVERAYATIVEAAAPGGAGMDAVAAAVRALAGVLAASEPVQPLHDRARALAGLALLRLRAGPPENAAEEAAPLQQRAQESFDATAADVAQGKAERKPPPIELSMAAAHLRVLERAAGVDDARGFDELDRAVRDKGAGASAEELFALMLRSFQVGQMERSVRAGLDLVKLDRSWRGGAGKDVLCDVLEALGPKSRIALDGRLTLSNLWA
ncbi:unnamed protein product [Pedinophyceae sp. YPF-701]|nr:unnamed protein product [Pedinophyceae sp. YPF-701]